MNIKNLSTDEKIELRDQLNDSLPGLEAVSLQHELTQLFRDAKDALSEALQEPDVNSAPIINAVTALIKQMTSLQETLYDTERQKRFEQAVITILQALEDEDANWLLGKLDEELS